MGDGLLIFDKFAADCPGFFSGNLVKDIRERTAPGADFIGVRYVLEFGDIFVKTFYFKITPDRKEQDMLHVMVCGVFPDGSGRMMTNFLFKGTREEVIGYILSEKASGEFLDTIRSINESIRKHD